ncbi:MAG TPA: CDP-alcohol phosphatidyltransferase family protein [Planctomycetaceae bacterium]|nr:CDP-alcohol phosphatidyltransferase family protein [Planctomycetaceae bacterium]HQZ64986.1 CDP-alcohol phosphatidyltransferase family protein [Planctomycetaceae bacterium]
MSHQQPAFNHPPESAGDLDSDSIETKNDTSTEDAPEGNLYRHSIVTIPNVICAFRLLGALALFGIALTNNPVVFASVFIVLNLSDFIDGRLARWLHQRSDFGARLDSVADAVLYGALFFGLIWLKWDILKPEMPWWLTAFFSYVLTTSAGLWKYGKAPSYHTYGAKASQWFVLVGIVCLFLDYTLLPFRVAMIAVTLTNLEATAITWRLKEWRADVLTILHVLPKRRSSEQNLME